MATSTAQPPAVEPTNDEDLQAKLTHLKASATQQYSLKNYSAAAEFYSEAAEVQDAINGEMSPDNADLLYQYGRCLYHVGVSKSDVLGGKVAGSGEEPKKKKRKIAKGNGEGSSKAGGDGEGNAVIGGAIEKGEQVKEEGFAKPADSGANPFFQITGDENWTDSEDEDEDGEDADGEGDDDEEEDDDDDDDFAIAYEILDVARVLLRRKIDSLLQDTKNSKKSSQEDSPEIHHLKERLADTYDLQSEIKLENEQFADAVSDGRESLALKLQLYPQESGIVAEAHYKLSIALDFASLPTAPAGSEEADRPKPTDEPDETMRAEAAEEMEKAIASCNLRVEKDTAALPALPAAKQEPSKRAIADVKSMIAEMKKRLGELKAPTSEAATLDPLAGGEGVGGVLGSILGESKEEQRKRIEEATASANDLSGMVKRKRAKPVEPAGVEYEGKGKRKAEDGDGGEGSNGKKVKFEEGA